MSTNFIAEVLRLKHENTKLQAKLDFARTVTWTLSAEIDFLRRPAQLDQDPYWLQRMLPKEEQQ